MTKDDIKKLILTLDLGYTYRISDYASSDKQEQEYKLKGLAEVDKVVDKLMDMIDEHVDDQIWHATIGSE